MKIKALFPLLLVSMLLSSCANNNVEFYVGGYYNPRRLEDSDVFYDGYSMMNHKDNNGNLINYYVTISLCLSNLSSQSHNHLPPEDYQLFNESTKETYEVTAKGPSYSYYYYEQEKKSDYTIYCNYYFYAYVPTKPEETNYYLKFKLDKKYNVTLYLYNK